MNGWLWVGCAFLFLAWTIGAYAYGRAIGFSLGMLVGSKTLATSRGAGQESVPLAVDYCTDERLCSDQFPCAWHGGKS